MVPLVCAASSLALSSMISLPMRPSYQQIKTTHSQRYFVQPYKGWVFPNFSVDLKVILHKREKQKLLHIIDFLGQKAIDIYEAYLFVKSYSSVSFGSDTVEINDGYWKSMSNIETVKIRVYNYIDTYFPLVKHGRVPPPFTKYSAAVYHCLEEIERIDRDDDRKRWGGKLVLYVQ